jgi:hypothetical protein
MDLRADRYIVVLICATAWAQQGSSPVGATEPVPQFGNPGSTLQYHHREWRVIKRTKATFDAAAGPSELALLRSLKATGASGAGQPLSDVDLLILQSGRIIYDYLGDGLNSSESTGTRFYMDDYLETGDLANDRAPTVLFHSGTQGASDSVTQEHILRYDKSKGSFMDVAPEEFYNSGTHGLRWFTLATGTFVVVSDRNWNPATPLEDRCHYCSSPFKYAAYQWSGKNGAFIVYRRFYGTESYSQADEALKGDRTLIESALNDKSKPR